MWGGAAQRKPHRIQCKCRDQKTALGSQVSPSTADSGNQILVKQMLWCTEPSWWLCRRYLEMKRRLGVRTVTSRRVWEIRCLPNALWLLIWGAKREQMKLSKLLSWKPPQLLEQRTKMEFRVKTGGGYDFNFFIFFIVCLRSHQDLLGQCAECWRHCVQ